MSIHLPSNLHEKMEFTISQYIGELHDLDVIKEGKEYYPIHRIIVNVTFENFIINLLFDDTSPKYNKIKLFNQIAVNYFNEEDKNEVEKYYTDYVTTKTNHCSKKRRDKWLESKDQFMFMLAYLFSKTNKTFIMEQIEYISSSVILK